MPIGISVHNSFNSRLEGNQIWLTTRASISLGMDIADGNDYMRGNVVAGNTLLAARSGTGGYPNLPDLGRSVAIDFAHGLQGQSAITNGSNSFSGNTIAAVNGLSLPVAIVTGPGGSRQLRLSQWRGLVPLDKPAVGDLRFALFQADTGTELLGNGGFDVSLDGWATYFAGGAGAGSVAFASGLSGCAGPCATFRTGGANDSLMSAPFVMTAGVPHLVSFTAVFGAAGSVASPYIFKAASPYSNALDASGFRSWTARDGLASDVQDYMAIFVPALSDPVRLALKVATAGVPISFDQISVRRLFGYSLSGVAEYAAVVHAEPGQTVNVTCATLGWADGCTAVQLDGRPAALPQTLPAGTSALYLRGNSPWRR
jgi:hypothetical protein